MIKNGLGGAKTKTGLNFESRVSLQDAFTKIQGYLVRDKEIFFNNTKVAQLFKKHDLYKLFLINKGVNYKEIISKKLLPDDAVFVISANTLFIVEMKFQAVAGSVDEKLQTCDFKKKQYIKLLTPLKINVEYVYILNDWFKKPEYKDVLDYIKDSKCYYFFNEVPLDFFKLPIIKK
jgi:hypothetical protein